MLQRTNLGINILYPFNSEDILRRKQKANADNILTTLKKHMPINGTVTDVGEDWNFTPANEDEFYAFAQSNALKAHNFRLVFSNTMTPVFVLNESLGKVPFRALSMAYLTAFAHPKTFIMCGESNPNTYKIINHLFAGVNDPPTLVGSIKELSEKLNKTRYLAPA